MMDEYGIDGVYLDGTANRGLRQYPPRLWVQEARRERRDHVHVLRHTEMMRRIYTLVKTRKPDGIVNVHQSTCMTIPSLAWATSYWDGEQFGSMERGPNPSRYSHWTRSAASSWTAVGVPAEFLCYNKPYTYTEAMSFTLLHDVLVRGSLGGSLELESKLWKAWRPLDAPRRSGSRTGAMTT